MPSICPLPSPAAAAGWQHGTAQPAASELPAPEPTTALCKPAHSARDSGVIGTLPHLGVNETGVRGLAGHSLAQHPRGPTELCEACEQGE